jgi:hypothetical protein
MVELMRKGDVGTQLSFVVKDEDGNVVNLTTAMAVTLKMILKSTTLERACTVDDAVNGEVSYITTVDDPPASAYGTMRMQLHVDYPGGIKFYTDIVEEIIAKSL